ncbi:L,D-transpeptidase [Nocardioides sp.]|uniref:L,D-transpeptidase n=1 Tax=Nocardioides sp. TaxID=35761 RepID=UPI003D13227E
MGQHRREPVRPRYGRVGAAVASLAVTLIALLGGIGMLPSSAGNAGDQPTMALDSAGGAPQQSAGGAGEDTSAASAASTTGGAAQTSGSTDSADPGPSDVTGASTSSSDPASHPLPSDSGSGRRVVFSEAEQRVWLVDADDTVERTYLVSGSLTDNLDPGTYSVYSRSEKAWGIDDSGTMEWFVRFTTGDTGAAIGFHDIPVDNGAPVQSKALLGTPQSHGCIRQRESDAKALWDFAPLETTVVVTT